MWNDRDRLMLDDLERQLEHDDPAWVRQFKHPKPPRRTRRDLLPVTAVGLLVLLAALGLLLDITVAAVIFGSAAIVVARIGYRTPRPTSRSWRCSPLG
jgi:Protein of unknown function (DUF3040)